MQKLSSVSNETLHELTLSSSKNEKSATLILLEHLAEVDARRLYSILGYSSLWEYVHKALNYSESQSSERVSAMRLIVKIPEVKKELENGNLSLTSTAKLASHVRREKSSASETVLLLNEIKGKASREVERVLASESIAHAKPDQVKVITPDLTRITIEVDEEFLILLNRVKEITGHAASTPQELFKTALERLVKKHEQPIKKTKGTVDANALTTQPLRAQKVVQTKCAGVVTPQSSLSPTSSSPKCSSRASLPPASSPQASSSQPLSSQSRYISREVKTAVRIRSQDQCEYVGDQQKRCDSKMNLQFDHAIPFALGGQNTFENIRHYCANHNRLWAVQVYGFEKMGRFIKI